MRCDACPSAFITTTETVDQTLSNLRATPIATSTERNTHQDAVHKHAVDGTLVQLIGVASHNPVCGLTR